VFDEGKGLSTKEQQYDPTSIINEARGHVDAWRSLPNPNQWQVTPETARLLQHWRHHKFGGVRPFFCQVEAVETAIGRPDKAKEAALSRGLSLGLSLCRLLPVIGLHDAGLRLQPMQIVGDLLRMAGGGEDRALVVLQDFQPGRDIGGVVVAGFRRDAKIGA